MEGIPIFRKYLGTNQEFEKLPAKALTVPLGLLINIASSSIFILAQTNSDKERPIFDAGQSLTGFSKSLFFSILSSNISVLCLARSFACYNIFFFFSNRAKIRESLALSYLISIDSFR